MSTLYTIGQSNKLMDALENAGFTPGDVTKLQQFKDLAKLKAVLSGLAQIVTTKHVINCDIVPLVPNGWKVVQHVKGGQLEWNPADVELYLDESQKEGKSIKGNKLRQRLAKLIGKRVMNANILDFLLDHPELIPEEWKGKAIFFWGTVYRSSDGNLCVRYLYWDGGRWHWIYCGIGNDFDGADSAALYKYSLGPGV